MEKYRLIPGGREYSFEERRNVLSDLAGKISIIGSFPVEGQSQHIMLKPGADMRNVKSILKNHFGIDYRTELCWIKGEDGKYSWTRWRFASKADILRLCEIYLKNNMDLDYSNRFDPLKERPTISRVIYPYGAIRYDLI